jgi:hypothetical protein
MKMTDIKEKNLASMAHARVEEFSEPPLDLLFLRATAQVARKLGKVNEAIVEAAWPDSRQRSRDMAKVGHLGLLLVFHALHWLVPKPTLLQQLQPVNLVIPPCILRCQPLHSVV